MTHFVFSILFAMGQSSNLSNDEAKKQGLLNLGLVVFMLVVMYVMVFRPQQKKAKEQALLLKGLKVGVPGFNSIIELFLRKWLLDHKVPRDQVAVIESPMLQMGDMLKSAQLDATTPIEPIRGRIIASGAASMSVDFFSEVNPDILGSFWMSTREWATAHRKEVEAFRASIVDGIAFIAANPDEAKAIEQKDMGFVDPSSMATFATKLEAKDFDFMVKLAIELGVMKQPIDASKLILN